MLKRHLPVEAIDGVNTQYFLPNDYIGASVNVFVNGVLYATESLEDHEFGFYVDFNTNTVNFYKALPEGDTLFLLYDSDGNTSGTGGFTGKGKIEVEANKWQLCSIPVSYGQWNEGGFVGVTTISTFYNYVVKQLEEKYAQPIGNLIEMANTKTGDSSYYYNYIPNVTKEDSEHNFQLVYKDRVNDNGDLTVKHEITGFWIKSKVHFDMIIDWEIIE